jgi:hypothetical protein
MKFGAALLIVCALTASAALAAELPTRAAPPSAEASAKARTCMIDGEKGILLPGSETCMRITGSVSAQVSVGTLSR